MHMMSMVKKRMQSENNAEARATSEQKKCKRAVEEKKIGKLVCSFRGWSAHALTPSSHVMEKGAHTYCNVAKEMQDRNKQTNHNPSKMSENPAANDSDDSVENGLGMRERES